MANGKDINNKKIYYYVFIISVLSVSVVILFALLVNMTNTAETLAKSLIERTTGAAKEKLDNYFDQIKGNLVATKQLYDQGILDVGERENINSYLLPVFNTYPQINTIAVANSDGNEYSIIREDSTWLSNVVFESPDSGMVINREKWAGNIFEKNVIKEWVEYNVQYDPRTRPWFIGAMNSNYPEEPWWTEPYVFYTHQVPGITVSMKSYCPFTKRTNIIQYDILLSKISEFTTTQNVSKNGKTFILTNDLKVIGLPNEEMFDNSDSIAKYVLNDFDKIGSEVLEISVNKWKELESNYSNAYSLDINNNKWWVKISRFELGKNRLFLIGVAVPENDFLSEVNKSRNVVIGGLLIVLIIIIIVVRQYVVKRKMNILLTEQKEQISKQKEIISAEKEKSDKLLLNTLPKKIVEELKLKGTAEPELFDNVTIYFSDFVGFTKLSSGLDPRFLISQLNEIFTAFDDIMEKYGCERIKTIGDAYMAICGMPEPHNDHADRMIQASKGLLEYLNKRNETAEIKFVMRIGLHSGSVVGGIVGVKKYIYDVFGDSVNTASRMESNGETGKINVSEATYEILRDKYDFTSRKPLEVKGKGTMNMYFVNI